MGADAISIRDDCKQCVVPSPPVQWGNRDANNALAGLLAGCLIAAMSITALPWVRRRAYKTFKALHWLWPAVIGLAAWHIKVRSHHLQC